MNSATHSHTHIHTHIPNTHTYLTRIPQANPGGVFRGDKRLHRELLLLGMWRNEISVVKRSVIEGHTFLRYVPVPWTRQVALVEIGANGEETVLRQPGDKEWCALCLVLAWCVRVCGWAAVVEMNGGVGCRFSLGGWMRAHTGLCLSIPPPPQKKKHSLFYLFDFPTHRTPPPHFQVAD